MENSTLTATAPVTNVVLTPEQLLAHWQGHRDLTRRVVEKFPEDQLFTYSVGGMRPFSVMAMELLGIASAGVHGFATGGDWKTMDELLAHTGLTKPTNKEELLQLWDVVTEQLNEYWSKISLETFPNHDEGFRSI
jgi:uncharacterized damage-inducible protein DinB